MILSQFNPSITHTRLNVYKRFGEIRFVYNIIKDAPWNRTHLNSFVLSIIHFYENDNKKQ